MTKKLPTLGVVGAYTGIVLKNFGEIHEVFDAFYPGIMQMGIVAQSSALRAELAAQEPRLEKYDALADLGNFAQAAIEALAEFGETIALRVSDKE